MQFILEQQAAASATLAELGTRQDKTDKRLSAITKLLQTGMKMLVKTDEKLKNLAARHEDLETALKELAVSQKELAAAQKRTEVNLNRLIDSRRRGKNGHSR